MNEKRTKWLLGILTVLLIWTAWHFLGPESSDQISGSNGRPPGVAGAIPRASGDPNAKKPVEFVEVLRVADLGRAVAQLHAGAQSLAFRRSSSSSSSASSQGALEGGAGAHAAGPGGAGAGARARPWRAEQAEAAKPKPQPFTMKYLGNFGSPQKRLAVFTDGKTIYNAQEGEVLEGKFIVAHIGYESVDIQFVGFPGLACPAAGGRSPRPDRTEEQCRRCAFPSCGPLPCCSPSLLWPVAPAIWRTARPRRRRSAAIGTRRCCST